MIQLKTKYPYIVLCAKACRSTTSGCRGTTYFRRSDLELVLKPPILVKKSRGGYRSKTLYWNSDDDFGSRIPVSDTSNLLR